MKLGAFSISLAVKDLKLSKHFYEGLGFKVFAGSEAHKYLIMKNDSTLIGLFEGMFDKNILTFNPDWDHEANQLDDFQDVRELQNQIKNKGLKIESEVSTGETGPGSFLVVDPDGNPILIDQHV
ncbi:MAG: glyoxalase [Bacteroidetes bacterium MedPE-SWsnd-G2]|mgnify:CR=1 FL=1|nr:MAG: glyoxalase [Bacteroidetes bacterium MedPE-SWsnd-G2]